MGAGFLKTLGNFFSGRSSDLGGAGTVQKYQVWRSSSISSRSFQGGNWLEKAREHAWRGWAVVNARSMTRWLKPGRMGPSKRVLTSFGGGSGLPDCVGCSPRALWAGCCSQGAKLVQILTEEPMARWMLSPFSSLPSLRADVGWGLGPVVTYEGRAEKEVHELMGAWRGTPTWGPLPPLFVISLL